jgi:hypothetical protein
MSSSHRSTAWRGPASNLSPAERGRRKRVNKIILMVFGAVVLLIVGIAVIGTLLSGTSPKPAALKPAAAKPLTSRAKEVAAMTSWMHGDGDMLYVQYVSAEKAWVKAPTTANATTWWQMATISLRTPPPVATVAWSAAMRDWRHAAQLAGGDAGAPTGSATAVEKSLREGSAHMATANAQIKAMLPG